jgi:hypothetical protein
MGELHLISYKMSFRQLRTSESIWRHPMFAFICCVSIHLEISAMVVRSAPEELPIGIGTTSFRDCAIGHGAVFAFSLCHLYTAPVGTRQRRYLAAYRKARAVVAVSTLALMFDKPTLASFAGMESGHSAFPSRSMDKQRAWRSCVEYVCLLG